MIDQTHELELRRVPGLFRRWEVAQLLEAGEDYHLEDAGTASDGTPLVAVYRTSRVADEGAV